MLTIIYFLSQSLSTLLSAYFEIEDLIQKSEKKQVVMNDVNKITAEFQVSSSKTVGGDRLLVSKFKILR